VTVNEAALVAVPPEAVTVIRPLVAPTGTVVEILPLFETANPAPTPLNLTELTFVKLVPWIVTPVPTVPLEGEKLVMVGPVIVKLPLLVAAPVGVFTVILPVVAPSGTTAVILPLFWTEKAAATPLKVTDVAPVKLEPLMVTFVPVGPLVGEKLVIFAPLIVNVPELVAVPDGVVTVIFPVEAPLGTVAVIFTLVDTAKLAPTPLNVTSWAPVRFVPLIVTLVPAAPMVGEKLVMVGTALLAGVKLDELCTVPIGVATVILPGVAPAGTDVVIWVSELTV
jgi:hypothetical protein